MEGSPEGTTQRPVRRSRAWLVFGIVFALYLIFRMVQGVLWLAGHL